MVTALLSAGIAYALLWVGNTHTACFDPIPDSVSFGGPVYPDSHGCFTFNGVFGNHILRYKFSDGYWFDAEIKMEPFHEDYQIMKINRGTINGGPETVILATGKGLSKR
ncbi:hypothetical protein EON80_13695 [bacterium]|nr:MAG: hypothetical protein EON80_13695 [bacterium]